MEQKIPVVKTFRYFTSGNPEKAKNIWFVLHGYGQLPEFFLKKFKHIYGEDNFIIAPEGMHRFYLEGTSGRVGASWMTKEARLDDIRDNINFLNAIWEKYNHQNFKNRILLGFSQGGATAARWHEMSGFNANHFILWASVFPPDLDLPALGSKFSSSKNYFVVGKQDPYFQHENSLNRKEELINFFSNEHIDFEKIIFDGKHDINEAPLLQLYARLNNLS